MKTQVWSVIEEVWRVDEDGASGSEGKFGCKVTTNR